MDPIITGNLIDICAVGMLLLLMLAMTTTRMSQLLTAFALQSLFLAALAFIMGYTTGHGGIYIMGAVTIAVKVIFIPRFLGYMSERIKTGMEVDSSIGIPSSLLLSATLIMISYFVSAPLLPSLNTITMNCLAISVSIVLIGLFMMVTRRKAINQAIGLLMIENGLFLCVMSISFGMPLIVELGIFFDVLMVAVIIGIFAFRISKTFDSIDTSFLRRLRD